MITDRQRSAQADTGHPLLCGKPYELFLVCLQTVCGGGEPLMCEWGLRSAGKGGVNAMTQFDFTGRTGGARVAS